MRTPNEVEAQEVAYGVTGADTLRTHVRVLARLLDEPHYDLPAWREHIYERIQAIHKFGFAPLDYAAHELLAECKEHGLPKNPYGTFPDAMRNLATEIAMKDASDKAGDWSEWLQAKAQRLDGIIAKAEGR